MNMKNFKKNHEELIRENRLLVQCTFCSPNSCYIIGTAYYTAESGICCAAIHNGKITKVGS